MADRRWVAKRAMGYAGKQLDRGQIFTLEGARNDEKLERLGYIRKLRKEDPVSGCGPCGATFVGDGERDAHARFRHEVGVDLADGEAVVRRVQQMAEQLIAGSAGDSRQTLEQGEAIEIILERHPDLAREYSRAVNAIVVHERHVESEEQKAAVTAPINFDRTAATLAGKAPNPRAR